MCNPYEAVTHLTADSQQCMQNHYGHHCSHCHHLGVLAHNRPESEDQNWARDHHGNQDQCPTQPFKGNDPQNLEKTAHCNHPVTEFWLSRQLLDWSTSRLACVCLRTRGNAVTSPAWPAESLAMFANVCSWSKWPRDFVFRVNLYRSTYSLLALVWLILPFTW